MCSATQCGLRFARSKAEVREAVERRSLTGPGKPYWKTPEGSTGGMKGTVRSSRRTGSGRGGAGVVRVAPGEVTVVVVVVIACTSSGLLRPPKPYRAAVVAAPTAADVPATIARVNLDMLLAGGGMGRGG